MVFIMQYKIDNDMVRPLRENNHKNCGKPFCVNAYLIPGVYRTHWFIIVLLVYSTHINEVLSYYVMWEGKGVL